jgi:hypothetical protein
MMSCFNRQAEPRHTLAARRSLEESENLPDPDVIAAEIAEDLRAALAQFEEILGDIAN